MDAEVTLKFVIRDICDFDETKDEDFCLEDYVTERINDDGFYELLEQKDSVFEIVDSRLIG